MARVTEIDNTATANGKAPPPAPKRPRGRPRTLPESEDFGTPSSFDLDNDPTIPFFDLIRAYPEKEWGPRLFMYLFRTAPLIDKGRTGGEHNIQKFACAVDEDTIMKASYGGSGGYKFMLNRWDPVTRKTSLLREHRFQILNMDYPPRIPLGEWIDSDKNSEWLWAKPKLEAIAAAEADAAARRNGTPAAAGGAAGAPSLDQFQWAMGIIEKFLPKDADRNAVITEMKAHHKAEMEAAAGKPAEMVSLVQTIAGLLKTDKGSGDTAVTELIKSMREETAAIRAELAEERRFNREMVQKQNAPAPGQSLLERVQEMVTLKDLAGGIFGKGQPRERSLDALDVIARVGEKLVEEAPALLQAFALGRAGVRPQRRPAATIDARPAAIDPVAAAHPEEDLPEEDTRVDTIRQLSNNFGGMFDEITPELVRCFVRNIPGMDYRDLFIGEYGRRTYDFLRKMDPQTIIDVIDLRKREAPAVEVREELKALQPPERVRQFVMEFLSDEPGSDDEDDEDETLPASPQVVPVPTNKEF